MAQPSTSRVDIVVKGFKDGQARGWLYDGATDTFLADRFGERIAPPALEALATPENPLTFTIVARGTGVRLGLDRDADGYPDRTELDARADPADPTRMPILLTHWKAEGDSFELSWESVPGQRYRLEYRDTLGTAAWVTVPSPISADSSITRTLTTIPRGVRQRYYRVRSLAE
jgi:hypothetical protein